MSLSEEVIVLKLTLHDQLVGYLSGYKNGRSVLAFAPEFQHIPSRPTLGLITHPAFPNAQKIMAKPWVKHQRLHPLLSNLLPEGALRALVAQALKAHTDNELPIFTYLGQDLPGALIATAVGPEAVPAYALTAGPLTRIVQPPGRNPGNAFSLAGVQMKFSMKEQDGRYNIAQSGDLGDWIIKTPSTRHAFVPLNEFSAMTLAGLAGVHIPEIRLIPLEQLQNLPPINLPNETLAFGIKRFDRHNEQRIHTEDFAQVLVQYPQRKYDTANYEQIGQILYQYSGEGLADIQQLARRLLVNILLANGDAHLKNWSLIYPDQYTPRLAPAYDIVTTQAYLTNEEQFALNLNKIKNWYTVTPAHFEGWANRIGVPWRAIKPHLDDTLEKARALWPQTLEALPMANEHKLQLQRHWQQLQTEFRINSPSSSNRPHA
ncbi:MAG: phosphatidylinositol kinase [Pusillimonas sp.]|nr:phosphatidylinositol kinase [Pusillimonas sp.]MBC43449.1 phosphatidylinositol kinase [Pusillimonas sp.]|tara:strand:+ start:23388 stop:24680 length:1293 start_codon:yes stop_codon:yes gene_type:complete